MNTVTQRNDLYLEELKITLEERCGVAVSESTIWRTLQRVGFRLKEVSAPRSILTPSLTTSSIDNEACRRTKRIHSCSLSSYNRGQLHTRSAGLRRRECVRPKDVSSQQSMGPRRASRVPKAVLCERQTVSFNVLC